MPLTTQRILSLVVNKVYVFVSNFSIDINNVITFIAAEKRKKKGSVFMHAHYLEFITIIIHIPSGVFVNELTIISFFYF